MENSGFLHLFANYLQYFDKLFTIVLQSDLSVFTVKSFCGYSPPQDEMVLDPFRQPGPLATTLFSWVGLQVDPLHHFSLLQHPSQHFSLSKFPS